MEAGMGERIRAVFTSIHYDVHVDGERVGSVLQSIREDGTVEYSAVKGTRCSVGFEDMVGAVEALRQLTAPAPVAGPQLPKGVTP
jgi:hypothetical protein